MTFSVKLRKSITPEIYFANEQPRKAARQELNKAVCGILTTDLLNIFLTLFAEVSSTYEVHLTAFCSLQLDNCRWEIRT